MNIKVRFNENAETVSEAKEYILNRSKQLLMDGFVFSNFVENNKLFQERAVTAIFKNRNSFTESFYVHYILNQYRNQGLYKIIAQYYSGTIVTIPDCRIESYLKANHIPYKLAGAFTQEHEYKAVESFYGNAKAHRSGLHYMNHIDEGVTILKEIGASLKAQKAFCLHPILQNDSDFMNYSNHVNEITSNLWIMALAVEYRNVANSYLSPMGRKSVDEIKLSPIKDVNDMLIADKIQNRKDFLAYKEKYNNRDDLDYYFKVWLERLNVSERQYENIILKLK